MLTRSEQSALNELCWHWDSAYAIRVSDDGRVWTAHALATGTVLESDCPYRLRLLIREDYARWLRRERPHAV